MAWGSDEKVFAQGVLKAVTLNDGSKMLQP